MRVMVADVESGQYLGRESMITGMWFYLGEYVRYKRLVIEGYDKSMIGGCIGRFCDWFTR